MAKGKKKKRASVKPSPKERKRQKSLKKTQGRTYTGSAVPVQPGKTVALSSVKKSKGNALAGKDRNHITNTGLTEPKQFRRTVPEGAAAFVPYGADQKPKEDAKDHSIPKGAKAHKGKDESRSTRTQKSKKKKKNATVDSIEKKSSTDTKEIVKTNAKGFTAFSSTDAANEKNADQKNHKKHTHKKRSKGKIAGIIAACICAVLLCGVGVVALALNMGKGNLVQNAEVDVNENAISHDNGKTVTYNGVTYRQKENMTSILLLGHDGRDTKNLNGQTDLVMVLAMDTDTGQMTLISIPRDTMVDVRRTYDQTDVYADTVNMQIATVFAYGSDFDHSAERVCEAVSHVLYNLPVNYYYLLNVQGIGPLANAIGGVTVEAIMNVPPANIWKGNTYTLKGKQAYYYVQYRNTKEADSAVGRLERQKQFLKAYAAKALDEAKGNVSVILDIVNAVSDYSLTNIGVPELTYLASVFLDHGMSDFDMVTLTGERTYNPQTRYEEFHLDTNAVYQTILDVYYEPLEEYERAQEEAAEAQDIDNVTDVGE